MHLACPQIGRGGTQLGFGHSERLRKGSTVAHAHPKVARVWEAVGQLADSRSLGALPEAKEPFSHFEPQEL